MFVNVVIAGSGTPVFRNWARKPFGFEHGHADRTACLDVDGGSYRADSSGGCNIRQLSCILRLAYQLHEKSTRLHEAERLPRPAVELLGDGIEAVFRVRAQVGPLREVLAKLACACVLVAASVCMMAAGFVFSVGMRTPESILAGSKDALAPIGYIGIFYGAIFLLSAVAVLVLQQLSGAADARRAYATLAQLRCERVNWQPRCASRCVCTLRRRWRARWSTTFSA